MRGTVGRPLKVERVVIEIIWGEDADAERLADGEKRTAIVHVAEDPLGARALLLLEPDVTAEGLGEILEYLVAGYEETVAKLYPPQAG